MVILKNEIKSVTHRFFSGRTLKKRDIWNKFGTPGHIIKKTRLSREKRDEWEP
jgi:hypothetical protein